VGNGCINAKNSILREPPIYDITKSLPMTDADKILHALTEIQKNIEALQEGQKSLQEGQVTLQETVDQQGKAIVELREEQQTLELKMEAFQTDQKQANIQILTALSNVDEVNAKETDKRFTRIEKHLDLPPAK
jgi:peptidoglycan hydrolase CwlO-like protein